MASTNQLPLRAPLTPPFTDAPNTTTENTPPQAPPSTATTTSSSNKKKKKKKKKNNGGASQQSSLPSSTGPETSTATSNTAPSPHLGNPRLTGHSKLSLKKQLLIKKNVKLTPWYDTNELLEVGRGLLMALKLFPPPNCHSSTTNDENFGNDSNHVESINNGNNANDGNDKNDNIDAPGVPDGLTHQEFIQLKNALHRVALWRGRSDRGGRLSHAVDMTAGFAGALLMDAERSLSLKNANSINNLNDSNANNYFTNRNSQAISIHHLRQTYSTLLLRSVNGLADTYRHQRKSTLLSVSHCCALAGLPPWIVDIRHDASHNELPSLGVCRIGALESLKFWKGRYWKELEKKSWGAVSTTVCEVREKSDVDESLVDGDRISTVGGDISQGNEPQGGLYTLAIDCLKRYQNVALVEAKERELLLEQQQIKMAMRKEKRRCMRQQQNQQHGQQNKEEDMQNYKEDIDTGMTSAQTDVDVNQKVENEDLLAFPEEKRNKSRQKDESRTDESETKESNRKRVLEEAASQRKSGGAFPWWLLNDDKPKKKKRKSKIDEGEDGVDKSDDGQKEKEPSKEMETMESKGGDNAGNETVVTADDVPKEVTPAAPIAPVPANNGPSSRDHAAEFIRSVPVDIAFYTALRFFVWGNGSFENLPPNHSSSESSPSMGSSTEADEEAWSGPALLPSPSFLMSKSSKSSRPSNCLLESHRIHLNSCPELLKLHDVNVTTLFENFRAMYDPLLIAIVSAYPGFVAALFVHLVDSILCLDEERRNLLKARELRKEKDRSIINSSEGFGNDEFHSGIGESIAAELDESNENNEWDNEISPADDDGYLEQTSLHLEFLSMWVRYIFSREFHMHFDRSVAIIENVQPEQSQQMLLQPQQVQTPQPLMSASQEGAPAPHKEDLPLAEKQTKDPQTQEEEGAEPPAKSMEIVDLKKKGKKRWTLSELEYMRSPLPLSQLQLMDIPLNSVCDRLVIHLNADSFAERSAPIRKERIGGETFATNQSGRVVADLLHFLQSALGQDRVAFMGIFKVPNSGSTQQSSSASDHDMAKDQNAVEFLQPNDTSFSETNAMEHDDCDKADGRQDHSNTATTLMSLEDMEAMLDSKQDDEEVALAHRDKIDVPVETNDDSPCSEVAAAAGETCDTSKSLTPTSSCSNEFVGATLNAWTLCKSWDACAIGTLPGYPT